MSSIIEPHMEESDDTELRKLLSALGKALTGERNITRRIEMLLDCAIAFYDSDRAYVIEGDTELVTGINTHERCAPGIVSQQDTLKDMPPDVYLHWLGIFRRFEDIAIPDMEAIRLCRPNEYKYFNDSDVHSIIVVPFSKQNNEGFVGVDNPKKNMTDTLPLRVVSYAVVLELNEIKLTREKAALIRVSQYPKNSVYVHLLGQLKITARGGTIYQDQFSAQGQALLTILLLNPSKTFSPVNLYDVISQDRESDNPSNVVANVVYRLRSVLSIIGLKELIVYDRGAYFLNQHFQIETDTDRFLRFYFAMKEANNPLDKIEQCHNALKLYQNSLPEALSGDIRWIMECSDLNAKFLDVASECVELHLKQGDFWVAYEITKYALKIDPEEPEMMLLMAKVMKQAAKPGLKAYVKKIMPYLDADEQAQLRLILQSNSRKNIS